MGAKKSKALGHPLCRSPLIPSLDTGQDKINTIRTILGVCRTKKVIFMCSLLFFAVILWQLTLSSLCRKLLD